MNTLSRNFLAAFRRSKTAFVLTLVGLSVAFAAFMVIMMQVTYDLSFNRSQPDADCIYRVDAILDNTRRLALNNWPLADKLANASPHIKACAVANSYSAFLSEMTFTIERNGIKQMFREKLKYVTPGFVKVFHFDMLEGSAEALDDPDKVLLPESMAKRMFPNESAIGQRLDESGDNDGGMTVGGVYKDFPANSSMHNYIYCQMNKNNSSYDLHGLSYDVYVKLDSPASAKIIEEEVLPKLGIDDVRGNSPIKLSMVLTPFTMIHYDTNVEFDSADKAGLQTILILAAIALVILIIAGFNFTNFSMAQVPLRIKNINTRKVLGASIVSLRRQFLGDAVKLSILSWVVSVGLVYLMSLTNIRSLIDADMALNGHLALIGVTALTALLLGFVAGLYPAYYITSFPSALVLKGSFGLSPKGRSLRDVLIGVQFVASFVLIVSAVFMYLQNRYMMNTSTGYDKENIIITDLSDTLRGSKETLVSELKAQSNIADVSFSEALLAQNDFYSQWSGDLRGEQVMFQVLRVDDGFLKLLGIPIMEGNDFTSSDKADTTKVQYLIFNHKAQAEYDIKVNDQLQNGEMKAVGFIPDIHISSMRKTIEPMAFILIKDNSETVLNYAYIKVRAGANMHEAMQQVNATLQKLSPEYPFQVRFFDNVVQELYVNEENMMSLITWFSIVAVLIAIVGVFGLVLYDSEYRRKEVGIRRVMGSTTTDILTHFNAHYMKILLVCFVIAAPIAWYAIDRWLESFAYKMPKTPWVFAFSFLLVSMITIATVTIQSWRVAHTNPIDSIKTE
jgi:putative ABC transport system permease protein